MSAILAMLTGLLTAAVTLMESAVARPHESVWISAAIAVVFLVSAILALIGRASWLLTVVWAATLVALLVLIVASNADMGLMKGGLFLLAILFYLFAGFVLSLGWLRKKPQSA